MIDMEYILNYGILGLWTAALLYEKFFHFKKFQEILEKNTTVLCKLCTLLEEKKIVKEIPEVAVEMKP